MNTRFHFFILPNSFIQVVYGLNISSIYRRLQVLMKMRRWIRYKDRPTHHYWNKRGQNILLTYITTVR